MAEAIGEWLRDGKTNAASVEAMNGKVATIFEACSFQDVTGQRIRRLSSTCETMLTGMVPGDPGPADGEKVVVSAPFISRTAGDETPPGDNPDLGQDAVNSLFD